MRAQPKGGYGTGPRAETGGHFEWKLDGKDISSILKSVEGGFPKQKIIDERIGSDAEHIKHGGTWEIDPITIDFGLAGAEHVLKWIQKSWQNDPSTCSGEIVHLNFNKRQTFVNEFSDAQILETTFPVLDGSSREGAYLKVKFLPQAVVLKQKAGPPVKLLTGIKQKQWLSSSFRLKLDNIGNLDKVNKIESFTIKQSVKPFYVGRDKFPTLIPTDIQYPNLSCTIAEAYAGDLLQWHESNVKGRSEKASQINGSIEFLNAAKNPVFALKLTNVGLASLNIVQSTANEEKIKRVKFELFVGQMDLDSGSRIGFE